VYFGTDTSRPGAKGIYRSRFDPASGHFSDPVLAAECVRPSYFAANRRGASMFLYAVNAGDAQHSTVTSYQANPATGELRQIGQVASGGAGPCYVSVDADGRSAYVANYVGGTVATYLIQPDGTLSQPVEMVDFHDPKFGKRGPVADRQDGPHPHTAMLSPDQRFLIVNDLGSDDIVLFPVDTATARLGSPHLVESRLPGTGPRHVAFHPNGRWVYGIDELANRIDEYLWNETRGADGVAMLTDTDRSVSTLDAGFHGTDTAAEVALSADGNFVYGSNRGENTLVVFRVDPENGGLTLEQRISCGGKGPRHFTLDPVGRWLVCGNQDSATVTVFARDANSGRLAGPVQTLALESPMFTLFV
jgi:6-phosphogluconolactonase